MQKVNVVKLSRSLGIPLTPKAARHMEKRAYPPGQHGKNRRKSKSNFGQQLLAKQQLKAQYNIRESQLRNYFEKAQKIKGNTGTNLLRVLESRLDMTIHRAGYAPTIYAARQLVTHGHISVDGKKVDKPSYNVALGSVIMPSKKGEKHPMIKDTFIQAIKPTYLNINTETQAISREREPERNEITIICDEHLVVEYYSR